MMFAGGSNSIDPWYVVGVTGMTSAILIIAKAYDVIKGYRNKWKSADHELDIKVDKDLTDRQRDIRRDSATDAWATCDRLTANIQALEQKIYQIELRERECAEERATDQAKHATVKMVLRLLIGWAKTQKNPPPIPDDILADLLNEGQSKDHTPIPVQPVTTKVASPTITGGT